MTGSDHFRPGAYSPRSTSFRRRAATLIVATAVALLAVPFVEGVSAGGGIGHHGYVDRHPGGSGMGASGNIVIDARARRGYQISRELDRSVLYVYNLDTLRVIRQTSIPVIEAADTVAGPTEWLMAFDSVHHRLFAIEKVPGAPFRDDYLLLTIDAATGSVTRSPRLWSASERIPIALSYHAPSNRVYIMSRLFQGAPSGRGIFFVEERAANGMLAWEKHLSSCFAATDHQYAPTLVRSTLDASKIYLNCYSSGAVQGLIVRITLGADGKPASDEVFPAVPGALSTAFDSGSDRMIFLTTISGAGRGAWVFDGKRSSFLGVIATGDERPGAFAYSMGLDRARGRLYMQTAAGILLADIRRTPLGAGLLFRKFAAPGVGSIEVDPVTHRFLVPEFRREGQPERYIVYSDEIAPSGDSTAEQPDELTSEVDERAGVTGVNYSGGGRAYAARILLTGGAQKASWNAALGPFSTEDTGIDQLWAAIRSVPVNESNRELWAARVHSVALTNDSADASSIAADADAGTRREATQESTDWPSSTAECDDTASEAGSTNAAQTGAGATCDVESASVKATADALDATPSEGEISARSFFSMSAVQRESGRGIVARSIATVGQISIMDTVWIGSLTTTAETWARGRKGTAGAKLDRILTDVRIDTNQDGIADYSCGALTKTAAQNDNVCSIETLQGRINAALGGQAAVEFPQPDPGYYPKGSAGGYQAIIQKERFREFAERALNDDDTLEVPGMQLIVYSDGRAGRTRYVVQLAGVQAEAHYGVYLLPDAVPPAPAPSAPPVIALPPAPPPPVPAPAAPPPPPAARTIIERIAQRVSTGIGVALARPSDAALTASLLCFFALPAYLLWRRRLGRKPL